MLYDELNTTKMQDKVTVGSTGSLAM